MDPAKAKFIFGDDTHTIDLDDPDALSEHLRNGVSADSAIDRLSAIVREAVGNQILSDDPPLVWQTVCRLLDAGLPRYEVWEQVVLAFIPVLTAALDEDEPDPKLLDYESQLRQLPLPTAAAVAQAYVEVLSLGEPIDIDELDDAVLAELDVEAPSAATRQMLDTVFDQLLDDDELALTAGDFVVAPGVLCQRIALTTRLTSLGEWPPLDTDLAGFCFLDEPIPEPPSDTSPGQLVVVRHRQNEIVVAPAPDIEPDDEAIAQVRHAYEAECGEAGLPVPFDDLVLCLLAEDSEWFSELRPPLSELVTAAGLEMRDGKIAAGESVWRAGARAGKLYRIAQLTRDDQQCEAGFRVLAAFEAVTSDDPDRSEVTVDAAYLRHTLNLMADPELLSLVTDQFFDDGREPAAVDTTAAFARRLTVAASRPLQRATAAWLAAVVSERRADPLAAAEALAESVRHSPEFYPAVDRLAWTRADQGRAAEAKALWSRVHPADHPDLTCIEEAMAAPPNPAAAGMRRNEPCWCGSGRKYKVCHLRVTELPPLPDRFGWMLRKTIGYLERRGAPVVDVVGSLAWRLTDEDPDRLAEVLQEPLVLDLVLLEHGWFERFLAERGPLLPEDERLLYAAWLQVPRTLYEVVAIRRDDGVTLRDLRTGDITEVVDRAFSREATASLVICARALPDGRGHKFGPAIFSVPSGHEQRLLEILDRPDGTSIVDGLVSYFAAATRPASLMTTEGEPFDLEAAPPLAPPSQVVSLDAADPDARSALARWLEQQEKRWCAEPVPALDDLTPQQAAADPTRREQVIRLIDSYGPDGGGTDDGVVTMRPDRLRELLGIGVV